MDHKELTIEISKFYEDDEDEELDELDEDEEVDDD